MSMHTPLRGARSPTWALCGVHGQHTGRAAKDKYVVDEPNTTKDIWWGKVNVKYAEEKFNALHQRMTAYLRGKNRVCAGQ